MKTDAAINMEDVVNEVDALLKLLGEAYQRIVEETHEGGSMATGLQTLRWSTMDRLKSAATQTRNEVQTLRNRVHELEAPAKTPRTPH